MVNKEENTIEENTMITPMTAIERQQNQFLKAGYKVERKEVLDSSKQFIEVYDPENDISDGELRKVIFLYDGTGNIFEKMTATKTPYELNHDKEKRVF
ncbi:hypothetical protein [Aquimarina aggregata]|uniref:hypothetical protein n=1 Tax=Aquimarina aggregata TaxID=1642818 RepID=UPI00248FDEDF|nr:hypothetical protein [Aquimarina aggregata]